MRNSKSSTLFSGLSTFVVLTTMVASTATADLDVDLADTGTGSCTLSAVTAGCTIGLDLKLRQPGGAVGTDGVIAYGASVVIRDSGNAIVDFGAHAGLSSFTLTANPVLFGFSNFVGLTNSAPFVSNDANSGKDVLRAYNGAVANPAAPAQGDGLFEPATGGNGGQNGITLAMVGLLPGAYTLNLESAFGDGAIFGGAGVLAQVGTIPFTVPEPGIVGAQLAALGAVGIFGVLRRRGSRRLAA